MVQKTISLDVWKPSMDFIRVIKGEADTRVLNLRLMNGENPVDLSGKTAALYYTKPDGTEEFIAAQISSDTAQEGYAAITLTSQACAAAGMITDAEIRIIGEGGSNLRAKVPRIYIAPSALDDAIVSSSEFQALDVALDLARSSTEAANTAAAKAETNAAKAEDAAADAEEQAVSAATAAQSANAERLQSAAQTTLCEQATEQCNTAINRANTAAESCEELSENLSTLIAQETREIIDGEKAQPSGLATLDASGKVVQNPASTGAANGLATLDASGKLVQMPAATDVGAIPATEKAQSSGVATLDTNGNLVQSIPLKTTTMTIKYESSNTYTLNLYKIGKLVIISSTSWMNLGTIPAGEHSIGWVPEGYRPKDIPGGTLGDTALVVSTSGNMSVMPLSSKSVSGNLSVCYVIE